MKNLLIVLVTMLSTLVFGQNSEIEKKEIWKEVIAHIKQGDLKEVVKRTKFPFDLNGEELSKEEFIEEYPSIFPKGILSTFELIDAELLSGRGNGVYAFMLVGRNEKFDFADIIFKKLDGTWYLTSIEIEFLEFDHQPEPVSDQLEHKKGTLVHSEYNELIGGNIFLFVHDKDELTCGSNHISAIVENVQSDEIVFTASGGSISLKYGPVRSYIYTPDCSVDQHFIALTRKTSEGKFIHLTKIDLQFPKK